MLWFKILKWYILCIWYKEKIISQSITFIFGVIRCDELPSLSQINISDNIVLSKICSDDGHRKAGRNVIIWHNAAQIKQHMMWKMCSSCFKFYKLCSISVWISFFFFWENVVLHDVDVVLVGYVDMCSLPRSSGNCTQKLSKWFFDQAENRCMPFYYTGCDGNTNQFDSEAQCDQKCPKVVGELMSGWLTCVSSQSAAKWRSIN